MHIVIAPAATGGLLCLGLIAVRTSSPFTPLRCYQFVVFFVAIGFELAPCLDLVLVLCLSYGLDTDSIKLRIKVEFSLLL